jgi:hypothetical protein
MEELKYKVGIETDRISPEELIDPGAIAALVALNEQIEQYKAQLKSLADAEKEQGQLSEDQLRQQEELKLALKDAQSEYRNVQKGIQTVDAAVKSSTNTYKGLVAENKALMEAMRNVPLDDTTGELQRLQAQYNKNNEELKKFDATIGNHQRNVGNYKDGLSDLGGTLSGLPGPIGTVAAGMKSLDVIMKASAWGLVIAAVAGLINQMSKLQPVVDFVNKSFSILANTVQFFVEKAAAFFGIIEDNNITLGETIKQTAALADEEVKLRKAKDQQIVALAKQDKLISELRLKAADMTKSEQERLKLLQQVEAEEGKRVKMQEDLALRELNLAKNRAAINHTDAQAQRELAEKEAEYTKFQTDSNNFLREQKTKASGLELKQTEEKKRAALQAIEEEKRALESLASARHNLTMQYLDDVQKMLNDELNIADTLIGDIDTTDIAKGSLLVAQLFNNTLKEQTLARLEEEGRFAESMELQKQYRIQELTQMFIADGLDANQAALDAQFQANLEYQDKIRKAEQDTADFKKGLTDQEIANIQFAANAALSIGKNVFGESKGLAVAQAVIDSLGAAVSVMRDTKGPVWKRLASAAVILSAGYANVKKILSTKPGSANTSGATATASSAMSSMAVTPAGTLINQGLAGGMFAQQVAQDFEPQSARGTGVVVQANVDRRGLAIAVREGERSIRTQQFDYK